jgi:hypothetical protein
MINHFSVVEEFIKHYGAGLFTQHLLTPSSLRSILRGGVRPFLERLIKQDAAGQIGAPLDSGEDGESNTASPIKLIEAINAGDISLKQATSRLRLILESVAENHSEYRDWNSTTTQSDRGDYLYVLLEFLRIKAEYERIVWTLRPVSMAHRVLVRSGATEAASAWRERMEEETAGHCK